MFALKFFVLQSDLEGFERSDCAFAQDERIYRFTGGHSSIPNKTHLIEDDQKLPILTTTTSKYVGPQQKYK